MLKVKDSRNILHESGSPVSLVMTSAFVYALLAEAATWVLASGVDWASVSESIKNASASGRAHWYL